jgi:hypothetical protein
VIKKYNKNKKLIERWAFLLSVKRQHVRCGNLRKWFESNLISSQIELASEPPVVGDTPPKENERHKSQSIANFEK